MGAAASVSNEGEDPSKVGLTYHAARRLAGPWWEEDAWRTSPKDINGNITLAQLQVWTSLNVGPVRPPPTRALLAHLSSLPQGHAVLMAGRNTLEPKLVSPNNGPRKRRFWVGGDAGDVSPLSLPGTRKKEGFIERAGGRPGRRDHGMEGRGTTSSSGGRW